MAVKKGKIIWISMLVLLALALAAGSFFWLSQSSLLAIENIDVEGNISVPDESIVEAAGPYLKGQSLLSPINQTAADALSGLTFIKAVDFDRRFPDTICIRVREYIPVLNLAANGGIFLLSSDETVLMNQKESQAGLPLLLTKVPCDVEAGSQTECSDAAVGVQFVNSIPTSFNYKFSEIAVDDGRIRARTVDGTRVNFGNLEQCELKFEVLRQLLARTAEPGEEITIDVTVPERPVTSESKPDVTTVNKEHATTSGEDQSPPEGAGDTTAPPDMVTEGAPVTNVGAEGDGVPGMGEGGVPADGG